MHAESTICSRETQHKTKKKIKKEREGDKERDREKERKRNRARTLGDVIVEDSFCYIIHSHVYLKKLQSTSVVSHCYSNNVISCDVGSILSRTFVERVRG